MAKHARNVPAAHSGEQVSETVNIVGLGHAGDGVTAAGAFVPFTAPGDVVEPDSRGRLARVVSPGPSRVVPPCPHFGVCGGCAVQHIARDAYLAWKQGLVAAALAQRGFDEVAVEPIVAVPPGTRRRAQFKARRTRDAVLLGFYERDSHTIVDVRECPLLVPALQALLPRLRGALAKLMRDGESAELHLTAIGSAIDLALKWKRPRDAAVLMDLAAFASALGVVRLAWNGEVQAQTETPVMRIGKFTVALPPEAFLQPTEQGERTLQSLVLAGIGNAKNVADLFSGIGTFALAIADGRGVHAVESDPAMNAALAVASRGTRVTTEARDLFRRPLLPADLARFDAVVLDPPRPGASAQVKALAASKVPRLVYVSCNPASFARDARTLVDGGYRLLKVQPIDQFVWSAHTELIGIFER